MKTVYVYAVSVSSLNRRIRLGEIISGTKFERGQFIKYNDISKFPDETIIQLYTECPGNKPNPYATVKMVKTANIWYVEE